jgi:hypothetical protein
MQDTRDAVDEDSTRLAETHTICLILRTARFRNVA